MHIRKRLTAACLAVCILLLLSLPISAQTAPLSQLIDQTASYLLSAVPTPEHLSIGGEWAVFGLARSGRAVPNSWFDGYYAALEKTVREKNGVLHTAKFTEYSRSVIALTAIGKDPRSVAGYDLLAPLGNYPATIRQGPNGAVYALLALDCGAYTVPQIPAPSAQATRQSYVDFLLGECQLPGGGWNMEKLGTADPDTTGMALQALSKYRSQPQVSAATEKALALMSQMQQPNGAFSSCESTAQILTALCELGIPLTDPRFVKNGNTLLDGLLTYRGADGGFFHLTGDTTANNLMSTEQAFYALVALERFMSGQQSLYRITPCIKAAAAADGVTVILSENAVSPARTLTAAVYSADGQFLRCAQVSADRQTVLVSLPLADGQYVKMFLTDGSAPLCAPCKITLAS